MPNKFRVSRLSRSVSLALATLFLPLPTPAQAVEGKATGELELAEVQVDATREVKEGSEASGYRNTTASTGPLGKMPIRDTPYSLHVTSSELFENRSAHTVPDALKTNPTVSTLMDSNGYSSMSRVMVRGFTAADQDYRDGLVDRSFTFVPLENVERIEVLNGLSSFLYGFSALGGSVNYVSKQPTPEAFASLAAGRHGGAINYLHGDAGGPIDAEGRWSYRANVYGEDGETYIEGSKQNRTLLSGVLNFKLNADTKLFADLWHQELEMKGLQTYINVNPAGGIMVPSASRFSAQTQYGQDWTYNKAKKTLVGIGLESTLNDTFTLRTAYRYGDMWRDYLFVGATLTDNAGHYSEKATGTTRQTEVTRSAYALVDANFHTGAVGHKLTFGYTGTSYLYTRGDDVSRVLGLSSIDSTVDYQNPNLAIGPTNVWYQQYYRNWVIGDRIEFTDAWSAVVGVSQSEIQQKRWGSGSTLATPEYTQRKATPSYALVFKPLPALTTYASYMEGLVNGGSAPSTASNAYEMLGPSVSKQLEIGAKAALGRIDLTAALFQIDKVNEYTDPTDKVYKQEGREVHRGIEFTTGGKLTDHLTLIGGFTLLDAEITKAKNNPTLEGKIPVNVPQRQAGLYLEYALAQVPGLTMTGGANYSGKRPVDSANLSYLDGSTTYDAGLRYRTHLGTQKLTLNLNVANLFDKAYWTYYRSGDGLSLGAPRTVSLTAKIEW
jgi:iron complex outermembrane receptor protein